MGNKIKAQLLKAEDTAKGIKVTLIVPSGSFKLKDVVFGGKTISLCIEDKETIQEFCQRMADGIEEDKKKKLPS